MAAGCPSLFEEARSRYQILSSYNTSVGSRVNVYCATPDYGLHGNGTLVCLTSGNWSSTLPVCERFQTLMEREIIIIGCAAGVVFLVLLALVGLLARFAHQKRMEITKRNERLAATLEQCSIRDPLDDLVRRESKRDYYSNHVDITAEENGLQRTMTMRKLFKIWTGDRMKKSFAYAESLEELKEKGREKLGLRGPLRIMVEEDGTEVDNDVTLSACSGQPLVLLTSSEVWTHPRADFSLHHL